MRGKFWHRELLDLLIQFGIGLNAGHIHKTISEIRRRHHEELVEMTVKANHGNVCLEPRIYGSASHRIVATERKTQQTHVSAINVVALRESIKDRSERFFVRAQLGLDTAKIAHTLSRTID